LGLDGRALRTDGRRRAPAARNGSNIPHVRLLAACTSAEATACVATPNELQPRPGAKASGTSLLILRCLILAVLNVLQQGLACRVCLAAHEHASTSSRCCTRLHEPAAAEATAAQSQAQARRSASRRIWLVTWDSGFAEDASPARPSPLKSPPSPSSFRTPRLSHCPPTTPGRAMAIFRSTPERAFPSIERVMVSAGLAPPLPRVATLKVHAPGRWEPRAFRYHPYARAPLPTHYVDHQHNTDNVFAVCLPSAPITVHRSRGSPVVLGPAPVVPGDGNADSALGTSHCLVPARDSPLTRMYRMMWWRMWVRMWMWRGRRSLLGLRRPSSPPRRRRVGQSCVAGFRGWSLCVPAAAAHTSSPRSCRSSLSQDLAHAVIQRIRRA
jgi:hypothetical protein